MKVWLQVLHREWFVGNVWVVGAQKSIVFEQEEQNSAGVRPARLLWFMPRVLQLRDSALVKLPQFSRFVDSRHLDKHPQVVLNLRPGRVGHTFHRLGYNSRSKTTTIKLSLAKEAAFSLSYKSARMTMDLNPSTAFLCMYYICFFVWYSTKVWGCFFLQLGVLFVSPADPTSNHQTFAFKAIGQGADFWCLAWFWCKRLIFQGAHGCKPFWSFLHIFVWYIHQYESVLQDVSLYCVLKILDWSKQFPLLRSSELLFCWKLAFPFSFHGNLAFPSTYSGGCGMFVNSSLQSLRSDLRHLLHEKNTRLWKNLISKVSLYQWDLRGYNAKWADWTFLSCCQESQNRTPLKLREKTRRKSCKTLRRLQGQYSACSSPAASSSATKFRIV